MSFFRINIYDFNNSKDKRNRTLGTVGKWSWGVFVLIGLCVLGIEVRDIPLPERIIKPLIVGGLLAPLLFILSLLLSCLQGIVYLIGKLLNRPYESTLVAQYIEKFVSPFLPRYRGKGDNEKDIRLFGLVRIHPFVSVYYGVVIDLLVFIIVVMWIVCVHNPNIVQWINSSLAPRVSQFGLS